MQFFLGCGTVTCPGGDTTGEGLNQDSIRAAGHHSSRLTGAGWCDLTHFLGDTEAQAHLEWAGGGSAPSRAASWSPGSGGRVGWVSPRWAAASAVSLGTVGPRLPGAPPSHPGGPPPPPVPDRSHLLLPVPTHCVWLTSSLITL